MGFAQKGGPVMTHIQFANCQSEINSARLTNGKSDVLIACDMMTSGMDKVLETLNPNKTKAFINLEKTISSDFIHNPNLNYPLDTLQNRFSAVLATENIEYLNATHMAVKLLGDSIGANLFMVGYAWQKGTLPIGKESIFKAIELNGVKPDWNKKAFEWGRLAAYKPLAISKLIKAKPQKSKSDFEFIEERIADLTLYQNASYAHRYKDLIQKTMDAEKNKAIDHVGFTRSVATYAYKLMAYKDEYEVSRLQTLPGFAEKLAETFDGNYKIKYHLSPPLISKKDPHTGRPRKYEIGGWITPILKIISNMKGLRGTPFDIFGYTLERKTERNLIIQYEATINMLIKGLTNDNYALAIDIANLPDKIKGYGYIKEESIKQYNKENKILIAKFRRSLNKNLK
jgi:indolepyruvate ferredoxin oxidoreductase